MKSGEKVTRSAQDVFAAALERPVEERTAFVAAACGDDSALRAEVESLLAHDSEARDGFLRPPERPAGSHFRAGEPDNGPDPLIGTRIGRYQIKSRIGVGGMGSVYEALQDEPRRVVALKVLRPDVVSRSALRRFQLESRVLAHLRHPNIAQVYEAGMHGHNQNPDREGAGPRSAGPPSPAAPNYVVGRGGPTLRDGRRDGPLVDARGSDRPGVPYFAMEYIPQARSIVEFAEQAGLTTRQRLELFAKVCDAVQHGHQKGIIHRDLKPGNILVDVAGEPKVIDFGVARVTDSDMAVTTMQTDIGQIIGTLQYMSPEQCDADPHDLDTRCDVYSLGVVLYELLCGRLPYDLSGSAIHVAARAICEKLPARPSTLDRRLRGDIEMIVLKTLHKDREQRYQSAADLASDIRRFLSGEPIAARPPTPWTRMANWIARHPLGTTTAACVTVAFLTMAATDVSVWWVNEQPYEIVLSKHPDRASLPYAQEARLQARSGRPIKTWTSTGPEGVRIAEMIPRPDELGGGRVIVLGMRGTEDPALSGPLLVFDADGDVHTPLWSGRVETEDVLRELRENRGFVGEHFNIWYAAVLDVFPDMPGDEIVAVFKQQSHSQSVIRIYDLAGKLVYQVWYDGSVQSTYWMAEAKLLVFAADCHWGLYDKYGEPRGNKRRDLVVFALRPEPDSIHRGWLDPEATPDPDDPFTAVWFQRLHPDLVSENLVLSPAGRAHAFGHHVRFTVRFASEPHAIVAWVLDELGEEVPRTRFANDEYEQHLRLPDDDPAKLDLPHWEDVKLVPYKATQEPSRAGDEQSPATDSDDP